MDKKIVMLAMLVGSTIGSYLPTLFGAGVFSLSSVFFGAVGGGLGIWISFKYLNG
jgi:hypothetical protein